MCHRRTVAPKPASARDGAVAAKFAARPDAASRLEGDHLDVAIHTGKRFAVD